MSQSFCPHCQADWARPWYDVCPACGHRFTPKKPILSKLLPALLGPITVILGTYLDEGNYAIGYYVMLAGAFALLPIGCVTSAVLLAKRTSAATAGKIVLGVLFTLGLLIASVAIAVAGCALVANRP
ncbi:hypothetical protein GC207_13480 [bacterium]|nr:hypothetical protein [bacterium]